MHACCSNRFNAAIEYTPPPSNKKSAYFCTNEDLPKKYNHILKLLENTTPKHVNYSFKRKVSVVGSEEELTAHVKLFKEAVPKDQTGKFSCFIFDSSCTFLAEMLYGNRKNRNHYQEICFYVGPMNFSESKKRKDSGEKNLRFHEPSPSRLPSEDAEDLDAAEETCASDDESNEFWKEEDLDPDPKSNDDYLNFYERSMIVKKENAFNFIVSTMPPLKKMKTLSPSDMAANQPKYHFQLCGEDESQGIKSLLESVSECLASGCHDESVSK